MLIVFLLTLHACYSEVEKFDVFGLGTQAYASHREKSAAEDRLHFFTEECDNLQVLSLRDEIPFLL